ncbi:MAG: phospholipase D family protein [Bacteroidales bacterium]
MELDFITNEEHYSKVIVPLSKATSFVWIGTADLKDLHVRQAGKVRSVLSVLDELIRRKVEVRLLHAKEPGPNFRKSFDKFPLLWDVMERQLCPRVHFKHVIIDGRFAYSGSANFTGAGLGMKGENTRNFESGVITTDPLLVSKIMNQFDEVWLGKFCGSCRRKDICHDPIV